MKTQAEHDKYLAEMQSSVEKYEKTIRDCILQLGKINIELHKRNFIPSDNGVPWHIEALETTMHKLGVEYAAYQSTRAKYLE